MKIIGAQAPVTTWSANVVVAILNEAGVAIWRTSETLKARRPSYLIAQIEDASPSMGPHAWSPDWHGDCLYPIVSGRGVGSRSGRGEL